MKKTLVVFGYKGDCITQLCEDYNEPLQGSLLNTQFFFMESKMLFFFFRGSFKSVAQNSFLPHQIVSSTNNSKEAPVLKSSF